MLLTQGLELLVYGMGTVILFLALLVFATRLMSAIIGRYFPEAEPESTLSSVAEPQSADTQSDLSPQVVAAICAALHRHRGQAR